MDIHASVARVAMLTAYVDCGVTNLVELKVGTDALVERKWLWIMNASNVPVFIGSQTALGTAVTMATLGRTGIKINVGDGLWLPVSDKITIYARANTGEGKRLRIAEFS